MSTAGDPSRLHAAWPPRALVSLWIATLAGPVLLLLSLEVKYALVAWACRADLAVVMHGIALVTLLLVLVAMVATARRWRSAGGRETGDAPDPLARDRLLAAVGLMLGALSALVVIAQWLPDLFLSPCRP